MAIVIDQIRGTALEAQLGALEDRAFAVKPPGRYLDDFPIWDGQRAHAVGTVLRIGALDGESLVSAAGVRLAELQFPRGPVTVALIGAVATAPEYRGRGLASELVRYAVQWSSERGAALAVLWGSEHRLYAKLGFAPCGTQAVIPLASLADTARRESGKSDPAVSEGWSPGLMAALKSRRTGLQIRDVDRAWLSAHKNVRWFWTGSFDHASAYAALGRGIDLGHCVHEWGGERKALLAVLRRVHEVDPEARLLGNPAIFSSQGFQHDPALEDRLGLVKLIDPRALFRGVHAETAFQAAFSEGSWRFTLGAASGSFGPLDAARLFFGPLPEAAPQAFSSCFPLPFWLWGLDAV